MNLIDLGGRNVRRAGAWLSSDFVACETVKVRAIRSLPVHVVEKRDNGRYEVPDSPLARVLHRPNALMTWGDLMAWAIVRRDVMGTAYIRVVRSRSGDVAALWPVLSNVRVSIDHATGTVVFSGGVDEFAAEPWNCREDGVVVLRTDWTENGYRGASVLETAAGDIGLSVELADFYRSVISTGDNFPGWLETEQKLGPDDVDAVHASLERQRKPENAGKMRIFEQERFVLEKVCRACHVDPHHVYGIEGETATASEGWDIAFAKNTVLPEVTAIEEAFQTVLDGAASTGGRDSGLRLKFSLNGLMRGDLKSRMEAYRIGIYAGVWTRAYCCTQEDIPWLPGQDALLQPTAYYVLDDEGAPQLPAAPTEGTSGQSDGVSGIEERNAGTSARLLAPVIKDAEDRVAARAARDGDGARTRDYARTVVMPVVNAAALAGVWMDPDVIIDQAIERGLSDAEA
jgi:phage portal protein BeeE